MADRRHDLARFPAKGNFLTLQIGKNPVLVIRGAEGQVHTFHQCLPAPRLAPVRERKQRWPNWFGPYQWTYELDGRLLFASTGWAPTST